MAYSALGLGLLRLAGMGGKAFAAAKPFIGKVGIPAAIGSAVGGVRGGQQGGLGGVIPGAIGGGLTGGGLGMIPGVGGLNPYLQTAVGGLGGLYGPASMGVGAQGASAGLGLTAQALNRNPGVGPMGNPLGGVPPQMLGRAMGPEGNIMNQLDPTGTYSGNRFGRVLGAQTDSNVMNILGNTLYGQTERVAKSEMARQAAAAQLKANIEQAKQMAVNSQVAGLNVGQQAAADMGTAMSNRSLFRYL